MPIVYLRLLGGMLPACVHRVSRFEGQAGAEYRPVEQQIGPDRVYVFCRKADYVDEM